MTDDENKAAPEPEATQERRQAGGPAKRHAVYDTTLGQYVGGVHASKSDASKAKSAAGKTRRHEGHDLEVREV